MNQPKSKTILSSANSTFPVGPEVHKGGNTKAFHGVKRRHGRNLHKSVFKSQSPLGRLEREREREKEKEREREREREREWMGGVGKDRSRSVS